MPARRNLSTGRLSSRLGASTSEAALREQGLSFPLPLTRPLQRFPPPDQDGSHSPDLCPCTGLEAAPAAGRQFRAARAHDRGTLLSRFEQARAEGTMNLDSGGEDLISKIPKN